MSKKIGFIGAGNMGGAIIGGIVTKGLYKKDNILVYDKNKEAVLRLGMDYADIREVCKADILFLCVKPDIIYTVIDEIKGYVNKDAVIISIAAGQSIEKLSKAFGYEDIKLIRVMPNTPALVGEGMSAISKNVVMQKEENEEDCNAVIKIFESLGKAEIVAESLMDVVTGISGSSPAYVFMFIEALADAAVKGGMKREHSYVFAAQAVLGSAKMVLETKKHPGELKDMVCSPKGTTIEAVKVLEEKGLRAAVMDAVDACIKKSQSM